MNLQITDNHDGEGIFPLFKKGTAVRDFTQVTGDSHWWSCTIEGHSTYIPDCYVSENVLNQDYNPTELIVRKGQTVRLLAVVFEWLFVQDEHGCAGWLPAHKAISKGENT